MQTMSSSPLIQIKFNTNAVENHFIPVVQQLKRIMQHFWRQTMKISTTQNPHAAQSKLRP